MDAHSTRGWQIRYVCMAEFGRPAMGTPLTPFQLWTMFRLFDNPSGWHTSRDLLLSCCDSAVKTLSSGTINTDLSNLQSAGYIVRDPPHMTIPGARIVYQISEDGILYVRQNLAEIQDACDQGTIPEVVISEQDQEIAEAISAKSPNLKNLIVRHGIQNVSNIVKLFELIGWVGGKLT